MEQADVLVVGAGPAGLSAARELACRNAGRILVIDRDDAAGGLPRFCHHIGFGLEYAHRIYSGPDFVQHLLGELEATSVSIETGTTMISVGQGPVVQVAGPRLGYAELRPRAVVIATGIREASRGNRMIPGVRPEQGVLTTGMLQQLVSRGVPLPAWMRDVVVVGSEHVSISAILTARRAGLRVRSMIEDEPRVRSWRAAGALASLGGAKILTSTSVVQIDGSSDRIEGLIVEGPRGTASIPCDAVLFSADWCPEISALQGGPIEISPGSGGVVVDQAQRTSVEGVFAAGNVLRGVETSGRSALEGQRAGILAATFLTGSLSGRQGSQVQSVSSADAFVVPQRWDREFIAPEGVKTWKPTLRFRRGVRAESVEVLRDGTTVWCKRKSHFLASRRYPIRLK